ncbi:MAG TPA: murein biosynthesis integral membrane protein MurJ [Kineosporiaceae bacterium]|nr:murein biosynthesis integral membrane protein MurJ [Kineosporiaceae bacterium]
MARDSAPGGDWTQARAVALGTLLSRATGFVRTLVVLAAVGAGLVADSYQTANVLPNAVYDLLVGGVLSSVVVPLLVTARRQPDGGQAYTQRLLTLTVVAAVVVGVLAVLAAPLLIDVYAPGLSPAQRELAIRWARLCLPQIPFYAVGTFLGAVLTTRGRYAVPAWAPVLNNLVVTAVAGGFLAVVGTVPEPAAVSDGQLWWIGAGTTAGVVAQTVVLLPALRRTGLGWRPRFDWLHTGLAATARMSAWAIGYVVVNQAGLLVVTVLATAAGTRAQAQRLGHDAGYTVYVNAYQLFQLPYALVSVSVLTVLLPGLSAAAASGRLAAVRAGVSSTLRTTAVVLVPAAVGMVMLGPQLAVVLLAHGRLSPASADYLGLVLAAFGLGLVPFATFQVQLRALYALHDARSGTLVNALATTVQVLADLALVAVLPPGRQVAGLALGFSSSYLVAAAGSTLALRRHLGGLDGRRILRTLLRVLAAGGLSALAAAAVRALDPAAGADPWPRALVTLVLGAATSAGVFWLACRQLRVEEFRSLTRLALHPWGRSRGRPRTAALDLPATDRAS